MLFAKSLRSLYFGHPGWLAQDFVDFPCFHSRNRPALDRGLLDGLRPWLGLDPLESFLLVFTGGGCFFLFIGLRVHG